LTKARNFISGCHGATLSAEELAFFRDKNPWGLILFKRNCETPEQIKSLTAAFRDAVGRKNAPVFIDQEGGRVQRLGPPSNSWRKYPPASSFGRLFADSPTTALRAARNLGRLMAQDLIACGVTADCLPVLDVPQPGANEVIGSRAYSARIEEIIALARAHTAGLMDGGVIPVMKHIPGHGRAEVDSHLALPTVKASIAELQRFDFPPFAALADLPMAMTAHVVYAAVDGRAPATLSRKVVRDVIRKQIGFNGLLMTDDLNMKALSGSLTEKCRAALAAGCDMLLHCSGVMAEMEEVAAASLELKGRCLARSKAALKAAKRPQRFDEIAAMRDYEGIMSL
jgi:beta-N-acetylhexosaminidase